MDNWKDIVVKELATKPEEWRSLGELFHHVTDAIPLHSALRGLATRKRHDLRSKGLDDNIESTDLDLPKAQWLLFTQFTLPLVERQKTARYATHNDPVRLKPHNPCETCGSPTYLTKLTRPSKTYTCFNCAKPKLVSIATPPVYQMVKPSLNLVVTNPQLKPQPKLRLVPVVKPQPLPTPPPKPPEPVVVKPMHDFTSLNEVWDEFAISAHHPIPTFQSNPKLRRMLHRALEAGAYDEYKRMTLFRPSELQALQYPNKINVVWSNRAIAWLGLTFTSQRLRGAGVAREGLIEAFGYGSLFIFSLTINDKLGVIHKEMEKLRAQIEPSPKQAKPTKVRWAAPIKSARNVLSRWLVK